MIALGFLSTLLVVELGLHLATDEMPGTSRWPLFETHIKSRQVVELEPEIDVLFIGSSITAAGIDPTRLERTTGLSSYNAGIPGATPVSQLSWLEHVVLPETRPSTVVVGLLPFPVGGDGEPYNEVITRAALGDKIARRFRWSSLITHQGVLANWDLLEARDRLESQGLITDLGHFKGFYDRTGATLDGIFSHEASGLLGSQQEEALQRMIEEVRNIGSDVVILMEPGHPREVEVDLMARYNASMLAWSEEMGVDVWNVAQETWGLELFADEVHFNERGASVFTDYIGNKLVERLGEGGLGASN